MIAKKDYILLTYIWGGLSTWGRGAYIHMQDYHNGPGHLDFKTTSFDDKNTSFQPTIVVTYISAFLVLNGQFIMFSTDIFYVLNSLSKACPP
jgi:hypothetical protein